MSFMYIQAVAAALFLCIFLHELYAWYRARGLPPGISGLRCLSELSNEKAWTKMLKFNEKYGDIASQSLFGYNLILVGSAKIAADLFGERSINYCDPPPSVMAAELVGWSKMMQMRDFNDHFRAQRKWFAYYIGNHATVAKLHRTIELETRRSLRNLLEDPARFRAHVRRNFTSIVLRVAYGYVTEEGTDPMVDIAELANSQLSKSLDGCYVDFIPILKYVPSWVPGAGFKKKAKQYAAVLHDLLEVPHKFVMSQIAAGTALPSLSSRLLTMPDLTDYVKDNMKWTALTMHRGGADTSTSVCSAFFLAMTLYPRVMRKAQQEIDSVVGNGRLPTYTDRPSLPYMEAVFKELLRWHTPGPITQRRAKSDDEYNGYLIPAGSYVMVNIWAILRDERTYTDPLEFKPERFLGENPEQEPFNVCFGFGRRGCPGAFLAQSTVWLMCVQSLAVFNISKKVENGVEITPRFNQVGETLIHQAPFKCSVKPRSETAERLIREEFEM